jgi:putative two-component system hydrogenase maturation factor HypX/HoxX
MIQKCKENEIGVMYDQFWDPNSIFHKLRYDFVYKVCTTTTPKRLKYKG